MTANPLESSVFIHQLPRCAKLQKNKLLWLRNALPQTGPLVYAEHLKKKVTKSKNCDIHQHLPTVRRLLIWKISCSFFCSSTFLATVKFLRRIRTFTRENENNYNQEKMCNREKLIIWILISNINELIFLMKAQNDIMIIVM